LIKNSVKGSTNLGIIIIRITETIEIITTTIVIGIMIETKGINKNINLAMVDWIEMISRKKKNFSR